MTSSNTRQNGFAAVAAIFILLVLAALGAFMVSFSNTQQLNSAQDVQGSRAYWAARAGLEWGVAGTIAASACPASPPTTIEGFNITVTCAVDTYADAGVASGVSPKKRRHC